MSNSFFQGGAVAETYVSIVPRVDTAQFEQDAEAQVRAAVANELSVPVKVNLDVDDLVRQRDEAQSRFAGASDRADTVTARAAIGQATIAERTKALGEMQIAAIQAAKADVALFTATGQASVTLGQNIEFLEKARVAEARYADQVRRSALEEEKRARSASTFRQQLRNVAEGEAPVSSLFGPASIARFAAGGLAIGAAFTALQHLQDALKVTGEEEFTVEGRTRNLGAALLKGDLIEGINAITKAAPTAAEELDALVRSGEATAPAFDHAAVKAAKAAREVREYVAAAEAAGDNGALTQALREGGDELERTAEKALALAAAFRTSEQAADDVAAAIRNAGSEAAAFGPERGGTGGVAAGTNPASFTDDTATSATADSVAESLARRTKGLQDDLAVAKRQAAEARQAEENQKSVVEGAAKRHQETVDAVTKVIVLQRQIDEQAAAERKRAQDEADAARKKAAAEAERRRREREAEQAAAARAAHQEYVNDLQYEQELLELGLRRASATEKTIKDDIAAEKKLIRFFEEAARDKKLTKEERRKFRIAAENEKLDLAALKKPDATSGGFSLNDLFKAATDARDTFGSNIGGRDASLSGQDERGKFGAAVVGNVERIQSQQLTAAEIANGILASIDRKLDRVGAPNGSPPLADRGKKGNLLAIYGDEIAAAYNYGVN